MHETRTNHRLRLGKLRVRIKPQSALFQIESVKVKGKRVEQRSGLHTASWMDKNASRFHDDKEVGVFVYDFKWYRLRAHCRRDGAVERHFDYVTRREVIACDGCALIHAAGALIKKQGNPHPAERSYSRGKKLIEPAARFFGRDSKVKVQFGRHASG